MAYPRKLLTSGEEIIREFRPHWRMLAVPAFWFIAGIAAIVLAYQFADGNFPLFASLAVVVALIPLTVLPIIQWWFTSYILTNERLITRSGVVARAGVEIPLENITNVVFNQSIVERLLKSGDLLIESAGESGQSRFRDIPDPEEFQSLLYRTREARTGIAGRGATGTGVVAQAPPDPTEQLERLAKLHKDGVLTDEEFRQKKQALLDQM